LFELLGEKYAPVKIIAGLQELAKSDPDINQDVEDDAKEFSIDICDRLEKLFSLAQTTLDILGHCGR